MSVVIVTDSASDIRGDDAVRMNVRVLPMHIRFGTEEYQDGVDLSVHEFYEKLLESDEIPKTSQITPFDYMTVFEEEAEKGNDVVCITLSSGVSGCYQSAVNAAEEVNEKGKGHVYVVDSQQFCISEYILVEEACRLRDQGVSAEKIAEIITDLRSEAHVIAVFDTLEYLKLGGRISAAAAAAGGLLAIKPVLTITDGVVDVIGKARGSKKRNNMLNEFAEEKGGVDTELPIVFGYTGFSDYNLKKYIEDNGSHYGLTDDSKIRIVEVGPTIGTYAGPGAFAAAFFTPQAEEIVKKFIM